MKCLAGKGDEFSIGHREVSIEASSTAMATWDIIYPRAVHRQVVGGSGMGLAVTGTWRVFIYVLCVSRQASSLNGCCIPQAGQILCHPGCSMVLSISLSSSSSAWNTESAPLQNCRLFFSAAFRLQQVCCTTSQHRCQHCRDSLRGERTGGVQMESAFSSQPTPSPPSFIPMSCVVTTSDTFLGILQSPAWLRSTTLSECSKQCWISFNSSSCNNKACCHQRVQTYRALRRDWMNPPYAMLSSH